ncbi:tRNA N6-adenosine threonylcarbamoyltransferase [bacterium BMS3Abin05]|nr:tRNA N6-adenosine threonylcarbamoyltransferase [bacterium BMS3Abin05]GBE26873.1 tRNA N6-adenosine threonylcarbamoyltransferase [bacterium BMS3Bbin03]HDZ13032.1 tRNA (adenosine(37)-N6)-threonylcarbamoyltransferase complex transferase subunit TsaD [Bacteroidota bacterium]
MKVLGIESSCDETAAAVLEDGKLLSNVILSQLDVHRKYGGVVPELASRAHVQAILPIIREALNEAHLGREAIDGIAVTYGPGLIGSLLVGLNVAKGMAAVLDKPLIGVNHIEGHIFANSLDHPEMDLPFLALIVSGGHTQLVDVQDWGKYAIVGKTIDDAAGEAFDKVAKLLGLGYPGGPEINRLAKTGDPDFVKFPRAWMGADNLNFSFSGLKTAVLNYVESKSDEFKQKHLADIAAGFQQSVVDVLIEKSRKALVRLGYKTMALAGGVARNSALRKAFLKMGEQNNLTIYLPDYDFCTDNAAMIARAGEFYFQRGQTSTLDLDADPSLKLPANYPKGAEA